MISRQRSRWPAAGLASTHLARMKRRDHWDGSSGLRTTDLRQELRARAQLSRAPFGTCCRVGTWDLRMVGRAGRADNGGEAGLEEGGGEGAGDELAEGLAAAG